MSTPPQKKQFRKRHLFPRTVETLVKEATKPLMNKQGKLMAALLSDWATIVGPARAAVTRPERLQFPTREGETGAVLHLSAKPSAAPELAYETEHMLEHCARYFGYRAITRIVLHATYGAFDTSETVSPSPATQPKPMEALALPQDVPKEMHAVFRRLAAHVASANENKTPHSTNNR